MGILIIETSLKGVLLGVARRGHNNGDLQLLDFVWHEEPQDAASKLALYCNEILEKVKLRLEDVDSLLVGVGPGSFTGIKIGIAFAQGIAKSRQSIRVSGVSAFNSFSGRILGEGEMAVFRCTKSSGYFSTRLDSSMKYGIIQAESDWIPEFRNENGEKLGLESTVQTRVFHLLGEWSQFSEDMVKNNPTTELHYYSLRDVGAQILESMIDSHTRNMMLGESSPPSPIYLKKSAPEEKKANFS